VITHKYFELYYKRVITNVVVRVHSEFQINGDAFLCWVDEMDSYTVVFPLIVMKYVYLKVNHILSTELV